MNNWILKESMGSFTTKHRIIITSLLFVALISDDMIRNIPRGVHFGSDPLSAMAVGLVVLGVLIRSWAAGIIRKTKLLAMEGPYAFCRHPLYLGSLFLTFGLFVLLRCPINFLALFILIVSVYIPKIQQEEAHLVQLFPEQWRTYSLNTPCLFPRIVRKVGGGWSIQRWLANREYQAVIACIAVLAGIELWHAFH